MGCKPGFPRGTTPPLTFTVAGIDLTGWDVFVTFQPHGANQITKSGNQLTVAYDLEAGESTITTTLTQADTLAMTVGMCEVEMRAARGNGTEAIATEIVPLNIRRILLEGEIGTQPEEE